MSVLLGGRQEFSLVINLSFCNGILKMLFMVDARSSETGSDNWVSGSNSPVTVPNKSV